MSVIEIVAAILGALCVGLLISRNHWSWPIGLGQVILTGFVFWEAKLYAETGLQVVFAILQIYGWWAWLKAPRESQKSEGAIEVRKLSRTGWMSSLAVTGVATLVLAWLLIVFTDGNSPILDAMVTSASLVAQYLLAARYLENWLYWISVDVVSIPLYAARGLYPLAILYIVFLMMAIAGWYRWRKAFEDSVTKQGGEF